MALNESLVTSHLLYDLSCCHHVVPFVVLQHTHATDALFLVMAVNIQDFTVYRACHGLLLIGSVHQNVCSPRMEVVVQQEVCVAVQGQTRQAGLGSFLSAVSARVAGHVLRSGSGVCCGLRLESCHFDTVHRAILVRSSQAGRGWTRSGFC